MILHQELLVLTSNYFRCELAGVQFQSPIDGTSMLLTPEESIRCQNEIGADIIMQLDDVVSSVSTDQERFVEATARSVRWLDR